MKHTKIKATTVPHLITNIRNIQLIPSVYATRKLWEVCISGQRILGEDIIILLIEDKSFDIIVNTRNHSACTTDAVSSLPDGITIKPGVVNGTTTTTILYVKNEAVAYVFNDRFVGNGNVDILLDRTSDYVINVDTIIEGGLFYMYEFLGGYWLRTDTPSATVRCTLIADIPDQVNTANYLNNDNSIMGEELFKAVSPFDWTISCEGIGKMRTEPLTSIVLTDTNLVRITLSGKKDEATRLVVETKPTGAICSSILEDTFARYLYGSNL